MLSFNNAGLTATTMGQYAEVVNVQYDPQVNTTYGVLVRYSVEANGSVSRHFQQLRSLPGNVTKADLTNAVVHDSNITLVQ